MNMLRLYMAQLRSAGAQLILGYLHNGSSDSQGGPKSACGQAGGTDEEGEHQGLCVCVGGCWDFSSRAFPQTKEGNVGWISGLWNITQCSSTEDKTVILERAPTCNSCSEAACARDVKWCQVLEATFLLCLFLTPLIFFKECLCSTEGGCLYARWLLGAFATLAWQLLELKIQSSVLLPIFFALYKSNPAWWTNLQICVTHWASACLFSLGKLRQVLMSNWIWTESITQELFCGIILQGCVVLWFFSFLWVLGFFFVPTPSYWVPIAPN